MINYPLAFHKGPSMIYHAEDLKAELETRGFNVNHVQEEDVYRGFDAEVHVAPNIVIQIDLSGTTPEFGATVEAFQKKRKDSGFRHIGYFENATALFDAIKHFIPGYAQPTQTA
jgi:hypothetical protein